MTWLEIDKMFKRAFHFSFSKNKFLFIFPVIAVCAMFANLFRAMSIGASDWIRLCFGFLPAFVIAMVLLGMGVVIVRSYYNEIKHNEFSYLNLIKKSWDLIISLLYITFPISTVYVTLWSVIGFLYFMEEIPGVGFFISMFLSFVPFLLVLTFIFLAIVQLAAIFLLTPTVALKSECSLQMILSKMKELKNQVPYAVILFLVSIAPVVVVLSLLFLASHISGSSDYKLIGTSFFYRSVFTSLVFSALCTPCVAFFFHFSAESYVYMQKKIKKEI